MSKAIELGLSMNSKSPNQKMRPSQSFSVGIHEGSIKHYGFPIFEKQKTKVSEVPVHLFVKYEELPEMGRRVHE